jgi:hypothetical protein
MFKLIIFLAISINLFSTINSIESSGSTSYNSLVATQCRARCLSLYPWKTFQSNNTFLERKHRSNLFKRVNIKLFFLLLLLFNSSQNGIYLF